MRGRPSGRERRRLEGIDGARCQRHASDTEQATLDEQSHRTGGAVMLDEADRLAATATKVRSTSSTASSTGAEAANLGLNGQTDKHQLFCVVQGGQCGAAPLTT